MDGLNKDVLGYLVAVLEDDPLLFLSHTCKRFHNDLRQELRRRWWRLLKTLQWCAPMELLNMRLPPGGLRSIARAKVFSVHRIHVEKERMPTWRRTYGAGEIMCSSVYEQLRRVEQCDQEPAQRMVVLLHLVQVMGLDNMVSAMGQSLPLLTEAGICSYFRHKRSGYSTPAATAAKDAEVVQQWRAYRSILLTAGGSRRAEWKVFYRELDRHLRYP